MRKLLFLLFLLPALLHAQQLPLDSIMAMKPADGLFYALEHYEIYEPHIVYAQAVLETGHFKSSLCVKHGNLFGIYDSRAKAYKHYAHWIESVRDYKNSVQSKYKGGDSLDSFLRYCEKPLFHVAYLLDASGGRGINSPIRVFDNKDIHIGYAGGMNPENVGAKLKQLLDFYSYGKFWIDMESGVRTEDDWLDLDKVQQVLDVCAPLIAEHDRHRQP